MKWISNCRSKSLWNWGTWLFSNIGSSSREFRMFCIFSLRVAEVSNLLNEDFYYIWVIRPVAIKLIAVQEPFMRQLIMIAFYYDICLKSRFHKGCTWLTVLMLFNLTSTAQCNSQNKTKQNNVCLKWFEWKIDLYSKIQVSKCQLRVEPFLSLIWIWPEIETVKVQYTSNIIYETQMISCRVII